MMNARSKEILTGITIIALAAWLFVAVQVVEWITEPGPQGRAEARRVTDRDYIDQQTGLRLFVPNRNYQRYRINNLGFRGPDIDANKPPGTFRLAFMGTSTTLDGQNLENENWPHLVTERLRAVVDGCSVDYVNAGIPRYTLPEMARLFEYRVKAVNPDLVIVLPGGLTQGLDALAEEQGVRRRFKNPGSRTETLQIDTEALTEAYKRELQSLLETISDEQRLVGVVSTVSKISETMSARELARAGADLLKGRSYIDLRDLIELRKTYNAAIAEALEGRRAIALPGLDDQPHDSRYFKGRVHFSPAGSEMMSSRVFEQLISRHEVVSLLAERGCSVKRTEVAAALTRSMNTARGKDEGQHRPDKHVP